MNNSSKNGQFWKDNDAFIMFAAGITTNHFQTRKIMKKKSAIALALLLTQSLSSMAWTPAGDRIKTTWGENLTPETAWRSYPRPQLKRTEWQNLNGLWECEVTSQDVQMKDVAFGKEILVPFCIESSLSGLAEQFRPEDRLWYRREFTVAHEWKGKKIKLHFGAVDYACEVFVNGKPVGKHVGGNNAFYFDVTGAVKAGKKNILTVAVTDPTDAATDTRGKQILNPRGIWYTAVSGIWKTVWLEPVSATSMKQVVPQTSADGNVRFDIALEGADGTETVRINVLDGGKVVASYDGGVDKAALKIPSPELWTPDTPKLYQSTLELVRKGKVIDRAESYLALREVSIKPDGFGNNRFALNDEILFQYGPLDQGWWPDGLLTPPSEEAMLYDMVQLKKMGFNMLRKHIKVEPELYYYYADSLGLMVWQDMPSGFESAKAAQQHVGSGWEKDWDAPESHAAQWKYEFNEMYENLRFFPSITTWVVFNEGWGQFRTAENVAFVKNLDPTRIINGVTGWTDRKVGDIYDIHNYPSTSFKLASECNGRISVLGEFGGLSLNVPGHTWAQNNGWGYRNMDQSVELANNYYRLVYDLESAAAQGLSAAVYTQTSDVEVELNGFMTYDRKVSKIDERMMNLVNSRLYNVKPAAMRTIVERKSAGRIENIAPKATVSYSEKFVCDSKPEGLSLWLSGNVNVKVSLNGVIVYDGPVRQTRSYNQFNISDYIKDLKKGENVIDFEMTGTQPKSPTSFDFSITAY